MFPARSPLALVVLLFAVFSVVAQPPAAHSENQAKVEALDKKLDQILKTEITIESGTPLRLALDQLAKQFDLTLTINVQSMLHK